MIVTEDGLLSEQGKKMITDRHNARPPLQEDVRGRDRAG